jgi:hypothetical protein
MRRLLRAVSRRLLRPAGWSIGWSIDWLFNRRIFARALHRDHVLCLGDSHVLVMRHVHVPGVWFRVKSLRGATASGVLNPNSKTQSLAMFTKWLRRARPWQQVVLQLGEVDCGFVIWHRAERHGLSVEEQMTHTLDSYVGFIETIAVIGFHRVIVLSIPLPTIGDNPAEWGEIANLRQEVAASQADRTSLTLRFNKDLHRRCDDIGVVFVDVTSGHLDSRTELIDAQFLQPASQDHHLADAPYARLISKELSGLWPSAGSLPASRGN